MEKPRTNATIARQEHPLGERDLTLAMDEHELYLHERLGGGCWRKDESISIYQDDY